MDAITCDSLKKSIYTSKPITNGKFRTVRTLFSRKKLEIPAVKGISFQIKSGESIGFIGPNGAGKSTTIKMLTGILTPTEGSVSICGYDPQKNREKVTQQIGAVFGQRTQLWWDLPVLDSFDLLRKIYGVDLSEFQKKIKLFNNMLDLDSFWNRPVRQLSLGQRMRAEIAAAFLHSPLVVFLDEPTIGLDVTAKHKIRDFIRDINKNMKTTIILTSHDMKDVEDLTNRIILINHGVLAYDGSLSNLKKLYTAKQTIRCQCSAPITSLDLSPYTNDCVVRSVDSSITVTYPCTLSTAKILAILMNQCSIEEVEMMSGDIDDIIEEVYTR